VFDCPRQIKGQRVGGGQRTPPPLLLVAAASGAFDLSVTLRHGQHATGGVTTTTYIPTSRAVAKCYLCAPPTSVASERLFSSASRVFTDRRNRLAPKKADILLFIKHNLALINFKY